ncbi:MAG TPA: Npt1/Npt2 family nucleotide transporter [Candidatus Binatia bacterium]|nr:Npt1/Npt2 family nucleotide transporter [Candidatus Binatia bacterium]
MAALLFFLLAANSVIKIVRDSLFLSRFPITELPYVYLWAALLAGAVIGVYTRYAPRWSLAQVILGSQIFILSNAILFWALVRFYDFGAVLYAFYVWSAIVGLVAVAQFWSLANELFNPREGKRLFGLLTAAGTLGAMAGGLGANLAVTFLFGTKELLWLIVFFFAGALGVTWFAVEKEQIAAAATRANPAVDETMPARKADGVVATLRGSRYLQALAALLFVSVVVSTLIDYQFKAVAKEAYGSANALAVFFGSYYAWLSGVTLVVQAWLTRRLFVGLGLTPSLFLLPSALFLGSIGLWVWPGLLAATTTRLADAALRTSVNRAGVEILYLPVPDRIKKKAKVFLDVTAERLGDGTAALIILFCTAFLNESALSMVSYFSIGFIVFWVVAVVVVQKSYVDALRLSLTYRELSLDDASIDYADKGTVETALKILQEEDERSVLFGLDLAERLNATVVAQRLPLSLLRHRSAEVRRRALMLFARFADAERAAEALAFLAAEGARVQAEAAQAAGASPGEGAMVFAPLLSSADPAVRGVVIQSLVRCEDPEMRRRALDALSELLAARGSQGEGSRVEAARLMGTTADREFAIRLARLIAEDPSPRVVREAMIAAGQGKYRAALPQIIVRLSDRATKSAARDALVRYGESAVKELRIHLFDSRVSRDIRLHIPRVLSKIRAQSAMDALLAALLDEDRAVRFQAIIAVEEMARRFPELRVDRQIVESAILSDALLYYQRLVMFSALFDDRQNASSRSASILYCALKDSLERVQERVIWLLSLVHPAVDIRRSWWGLNSRDPLQRAYAIELLDNLLGGNIKKYVFPIYSDERPDHRLRRALELLGSEPMDANVALGALLEQDDRWLKTATIWEIGARNLARFRDAISRYASSDDALLQETSRVVLRRI